MVESNSREKNASGAGSRIPFIFAVVLLLLLCFIAGQTNPLYPHPFKLFPAGWQFLWYALIWVMSIVLLFLVPRSFSQATLIAVTIGLTFICRFVMIPSFFGAPFPGVIAGTPDNPGIVHYLISYAIPENAAPILLNSLYFLFGTGTLCLLYVLLSHRSLPLRWGVLYAFSPVILFSVSGHGRGDASAIFFLMATLCFYDKKKWPWMFLCAGLAVQAHPISTFTLPFLVHRDNWKYSWIAALLLLPLLLPIPPEGGIAQFQGVFRPTYDHAFNSPIFTLFEGIFKTSSHAHVASLVCLIGLLAVGYLFLHPRQSPRHLNDPVSGCFFTFGIWILMSPQIELWHLAWVVPFLALRPTISWMLLCLLISVTFLAKNTVGQPGQWQVPIWAQVLEWAPFYGLLLHKLYQGARRIRVLVDSTPPQSVSVVIPALNEEEQITACIKAIRKDAVVKEIVVVDGGSIDGTEARAKDLGAKVITFQPNPENGFGRGGQIDTGIRGATGDVVAIIHADTLAIAPLFENMITLLQKQPMMVGGAMGSVFDGAGWRFRLLEFANDFRIVCLGISFGDQVQFFRRKPVMHTKLFPNIPLMEDVEFSIRLHRLGRQAYLFGDALVSTRKWQAKGFGHASTVIRLVVAYLWKRLWGVPDTFKMYKKYYGKSASYN